MAKNKPEPDPEIPEDPIMALAKVMKAGFDQSNANMQQLGINDKKLSQRIDNMEKNPPKKDLLEQITQILNVVEKTGILDIVKGALSGGPEEPPLQQSQVPPEGYKDYVAFTKSMQDLLLGNQTEIVRSMKLKNDQTVKEIGADF